MDKADALVGTVWCDLEHQHEQDLTGVPYAEVTGRDEDGASYDARAYSNGWVVVIEDDGRFEACCEEGARDLDLDMDDGLLIYATHEERQAERSALREREPQR